MPIKFITELVKGVFGVSKRETDESNETNVTVERQREDGTDRVDDETADEKPADESEQETVTQTDEEPTDEEPTDEEPTDEEPTDESEQETVDQESAAEAAETEAGTPVAEISGIGPTYSDRLADIGIETVSELADAEVSEVAKAAEVSESRANDWITQAVEW